MTVLRWRSQLWVPLAFVALGVLSRVVWLLNRPLLHGAEEARRAAVSVARTGTIADVFAQGGGLSAHLTPTMPYLAGSIYYLLGVESPLAEGVLAALSITMIVVVAFVWYGIVRNLGVANAWSLAGLAWICLAPIFTDIEAVQFRVWEGALGATLATATLWLLINSDQFAVVTWNRVIVISLLAAFTLLTSPPLGLFAYAGAALLMVRRVPWSRLLATVAIAVIVLIVVLTPWTVRNYADFGRIIPLRGNLGIEIALANNDANLNTKSDEETFSRIAADIHPDLPNGFARMQSAGGAIAYSDKLKDQTVSWIKSHPAGFAILSFKHLVRYYFPQRWQFGSTTGAALPAMRQFAVWSISSIGLLGVCWILIYKRGLYTYLALYAIIPALPYAVVQPTPRYYYIVYPALVFLAFSVCSIVVSKIQAVLRKPRLKSG